MNYGERSIDVGFSSRNDDIYFGSIDNMSGLGFGGRGGYGMGGYGLGGYGGDVLNQRGGMMKRLSPLGSDYSGRTMGPSKGGFGFGDFDIDMGIEAMLGGARNPW